ncbi:PREDICTED: protein lifeguard 2-like [Priapulus caudatus]|uniref:Protein lifeguard 2-like n=1 Tax=Priapulus caudatus TaxID=37621 RepID=A0ABM1F513_PRICU|nr:PREDICTED: protein lifeguard 2-like [Priapulus caudatus]
MSGQPPPSYNESVGFPGMPGAGMPGAGMPGAGMPGAGGFAGGPMPPMLPRMPPGGFAGPGYPQDGSPKHTGGYPQQGGGYPPQGGGYPPQGGGYPPQGGGYPAQGGGYPPQGGGYPAQRGGYPAQGGGHAPQGGGHAPQGGGHAPQGGGYPPQGGQPHYGGYTEPGAPSAGVSVPAGAEFGDSFSDKAIRRAFIRKVYLILMVQLLITTGFIALFVFHDGVKYYVQHNSWLYWTSYGVFLVVYIVLVCCKGPRRRFPLNFIFLGIFTVAFSYLVGTISSYYDTKIVLMAMGISTIVCLTVSIFSIQTKYDFTKWGGMLFVAAMVLMIFGIFAIILYRYIPFLNIVYSALMALLFTAFLAFDTQMVMGNKRYSLSPEEYIYGALQIYVDVIYIFLAILSLTGSASN